MPLIDITETYGRSYQADSVAPRARAAWARIFQSFHRHVQGKTWVDVGCGGGALIDEAQKYGWRVMGIEGSAAALEVKSADTPIVVWDLREAPPPGLWPKYDVVSCFDVAEHVGAAHNLVVLCADLARDWVLFGAAPPGQDGHGHIDLRPPEFWRDAFEKKGLYYLENVTKNIVNDLEGDDVAAHLWWVRKNLQVFRR